MRFILLSLLLAFSLPGAAIEIPAEIADCMKQNLPATTLAQSIELRARDRGHYESVMQANIFVKRHAGDNFRVMMHFSEPVDIRGARFLIKQQEPQNEMYIYMPGLFKVRRVTSRKISSSVMGTDFSYEDFERLHGVLSDMRMEQFPDDVVSGRPVYVHCLGGLGRTGTIVGCYLARHGIAAGRNVIKMIRDLRRNTLTQHLNSPETNQQIDLVESWVEAE